jgi:hypothetical protein
VDEDVVSVGFEVGWMPSKCALSALSKEH